MLSGFTSRKSANLCMYLMKIVYKWLPVAVKKKLYNRSYPGVLCLLCGEVNSFPSAILLLLSSCSLDMSLYTAVYKSFVIRDWYVKAVSVFDGKKKIIQTLVEYIRFVVELQCILIWSVRAKYRVEMEKTGLVGDNSVVSGLSSSVVSILSAGIVHMFSVVESFAVKFGRHKLCCFFSGLDGNAFVVIDV
ncbi:hypothetical protein G9A89_007520 [Geosiphon pyriformis]|nr:hypothetical protein G9A89_007520 [Geosiphon pyriformis]